MGRTLLLRPKTERSTSLIRTVPHHNGVTTRGTMSALLPYQLTENISLQEEKITGSIFSIKTLQGHHTYGVTSQTRRYGVSIYLQMANILQLEMAVARYTCLTKTVPHLFGPMIPGIVCTLLCQLMESILSQLLAVMTSISLTRTVPPLFGPIPVKIKCAGSAYLLMVNMVSLVLMTTRSICLIKVLRGLRRSGPIPRGLTSNLLCQAFPKMGHILLVAPVIITFTFFKETFSCSHLLRHPVFHPAGSPIFFSVLPCRWPYRPRLHPNPGRAPPG